MPKKNKYNMTHPTFPLAVFAFGTGESSVMKQKNIISQFSEHCESSNIVIEGPSLTGTEVTPNAREVAQEIVKQIKSSELPNEGPLLVNLTGFSRGAITCIRIANELQRITDECTDEMFKAQLQRLELNLFTIDPVTGMGEKKILESRVIPENVKHFVSILQIDEMRREFKPQDLSRVIIKNPEKTQATFLPMYGNHSDSTKIKSQQMSAAPTLVWQMLYQFFTDKEIEFTGFKLPPIAVDKHDAESSSATRDPKELLTFFDRQHQERSKYLDSGKKTKIGDSLMLRRTRSMNKHLEFYVKDSDLFTNSLERELFKIAYPEIFNYLFEQNQFDSRYPSSSAIINDDVILRKLSLLKNNHPNLYKRLIQTQRIHPDGTLKGPQGYYSLEPLQTYSMLYYGIHNHKQENLSQLAQLEQEIIMLTFRYDREKSHIRPFIKRNEGKRTQMIREEILNVMRNPPVQEDIKYERMLAIIQKHAKHLSDARSPSALKHHLESLLDKYKISITKVKIPLSREIAASITRNTLTLVKETIHFIGNLGYIGGGALAVVGIFIRDLGFRLEDKMRYYSDNPVKSIVLAAAYLLQGVGTVLKNIFGLKPLMFALSSLIKEFRDQCVIAIRNPQGYEESFSRPSSVTDKQFLIEKDDNHSVSTEPLTDDESMYEDSVQEKDDISRGSHSESETNDLVEIDLDEEAVTHFKALKHQYQQDVSEHQEQPKDPSKAPKKWF